MIFSSRKMINNNNRNNNNSFTISFIIFITILIRCTKCDILVFLQNTNQVIEQFRDLPAHFGDSLPSNGLRVLAIEARPLDGCGLSIEKPPDFNSTIVNYVAVMQRMNCSFEEKVRNAQKAGFAAAIVHNIGSNDLEQMSAETGGDIFIPSVFVGESTGIIIRENYMFNSSFALLLNDELPFNINTHLILPFTIVVGLCFFIMIGFMVVRCVRERRRLLRHRLPSSVLKKIPTIKFTKGLQYDTCAICLDDYVEGEKLRVLPCHHAYHSKCIDPWLTKNRRVCPICKRKVFARGEKRQRRRSSTDNSDSDADDTTPLLNPVDNNPLNSSAATHGTFGPNSNQQTNVHVADSDTNFSATDDELLDGSNRGTTVAPTQRFNPFDRLPNLPPNLLANAPQGPWQKFKRLFQRTTSNDELIIETGRPQSSAQTTNLEVASTASESANTTLPFRASSNSLSNTNLSGSFKDDETTDDDLILRKKLVPNRSRNQSATRASEAGTSGSSGVRSNVVAVVPALPNPNFNPDVQQRPGNNKRSRQSSNNNFIV